MRMRRLGAAAIIGGTLMAGAACQGGDDDFEPDAEGYLELACSIDRHQQDISAAKIMKDDDVERQLAYAASTAVLESGNRERDTKLQELSNSLKVAIDDDDTEAFDIARGDLDAHCEDDDLPMGPGDLVDIACSVAEAMESGPRPEVLLISELVGVAAAKDGEYDDLSSAASSLVIDPNDPLSSDHPDDAAIKDFQDECP